MAKKHFKTNNLVIICEGTETEFPYFEYIKEKIKNNFDDIKIVLSHEEKLALDKFREQENRKLKKIAYKDNECQKTYPLYITLEECEDDVAKNYDKYKQAPAKYVREAYLWLKVKKYSEAWAVYDLDDTDDLDHKVHQRANELVNGIPLLNKAFSAYSFEEWILLNFERCPTAFRNSAFKKTKDQKASNNCKGRFCKHKSRCKSECIGDYLTRKCYVNDLCNKYSNKQSNEYNKNQVVNFAKAIYEDETLRHRAYVNAAWSRSLNNKLFYECNPYSDVDKLIMRLLDEKKDIHWLKTSEKFKLGLNTFCIEQKNDALYISHIGTGNCVINKMQIYWCDDDYNFVTSAISGENISFTMENNNDKQLILSDKSTILCIKETKQEFYFENISI